MFILTNVHSTVHGTNDTKLTLPFPRLFNRYDTIDNQTYEEKMILFTLINLFKILLGLEQTLQIIVPREIENCCEFCRGAYFTKLCTAKILEYN